VILVAKSIKHQLLSDRIINASKCRHWELEDARERCFGNEPG
jgi:hypothetical protein